MQGDGTQFVLQQASGRLLDVIALSCLIFPGHSLASCTRGIIVRCSVFAQGSFLLTSQHTIARPGSAPNQPHDMEGLGSQGLAWLGQQYGSDKSCCTSQSLVCHRRGEVCCGSEPWKSLRSTVSVSNAEFSPAVAVEQRIHTLL